LALATLSPYEKKNRTLSNITEETRKEIYKQARAACDINKHQWARIMSQGSLDGNIMASVGKKEKATREPHS
jgi:hypothetical protein